MSVLGYSRGSINVYGMAPFSTFKASLDQQFLGMPRSKEPCGQMDLGWNLVPPFRSPHVHWFCKGSEKTFQKGICLIENSPHP